MGTRKEIAELPEKGLAPKEIAERLGVRRETVYTVRHMLKKEQEDAKQTKEEKQKVKVTGDEKDNGKVDTVNTIDDRVPALKKEIELLKDENAKLRSDALVASKEIEELTDEIAQLKSENHDEYIDELRAEIDRLTERLNSTNYALKLDREMHENERRRYEDLEQAYTYERESHRALLTYIEVLSKWTNESEGE